MADNVAQHGSVPAPPVLDYRGRAVLEDGATVRWTPARLLAALAVAAVGVWATRWAWADIVHIAYTDEEASHVWLVPFVVAWLVWIRREKLAGCGLGGRIFGTMMVALGWGMCHFGFNHARQLLLHGGAVLVVLGCLVSVLGATMLVRLWPAVLMLAFIIPVPGMLRQQIAIPLQTATARIAAVVLVKMGVPVIRSGNLLSINGQGVTLAEACNGMRMVFPLFMVICIFCFTLPLRGWVRAVLIILSPAAAILCNVIRLVPTFYLYGYRSKTTADAFHDISGWLMLPIALSLLVGLLSLLRCAGISVFVKKTMQNQPKRA